MLAISDMQQSFLLLSSEGSLRNCVVFGYESNMLQAFEPKPDHLIREAPSRATENITGCFHGLNNALCDE